MVLADSACVFACVCDSATSFSHYGGKGKSLGPLSDPYVSSCVPVQGKKYYDHARRQHLHSMQYCSTPPHNQEKHTFSYRMHSRSEPLSKGE